LIARTRTLTPEEAFQLAAAMHYEWSVARVAPWSAAWSAAVNSAVNSARNSARVAARYATVNAEGDSAGYAALALVVRDLITPEQFGILYGPWASVIGCEK